MSKRLLQVLALAVCLGLLPAATHAKDKSSSGRDKKNWHHDDHDRDERHARRDYRHEYQGAAGPSNRPSGWDKGNKTGWGDCNVPPGLARQRGCDSSGYSARERNAHAYHNEVRPQTRSATTTRATRPGETRGIILQRNGSQSTGRTTTATTTSTPKATQAGQRGGIILQRNATKPAAQNKAAVQK